MKVDLIYTSKSNFKNLYNSYKIFEDRIELKAKVLFKKFIIKKEDLIYCKICPPPVIRTRFWALKLDLADFYSHLEIKRRSGFFKYLRFTPDNLEEFRSKAKMLIQ